MPRAFRLQGSSQQCSLAIIVSGEHSTCALSHENSSQSITLSFLIAIPIKLGNFQLFFLYCSTYSVSDGVQTCRPFLQSFVLNSFILVLVVWKMTLQRVSWSTMFIPGNQAWTFTASIMMPLPNSCTYVLAGQQVLA